MRLVDWMGCGQHYAGAGAGARVVVNADLRRQGVLRRRAGMSDRLTLSGQAAAQLEVSGRKYLVSYASGSLASLRLT
jgi:hypothetical protein